MSVSTGKICHVIQKVKVAAGLSRLITYVSAAYRTLFVESPGKKVQNNMATAFLDPNGRIDAPPGCNESSSMCVLSTTRRVLE